ncbi:MAG: hypothetical protein J3Q66DRAFT_403392 [Benniella sp.]|nr:MAG: hypothetical protein J3Q66DRAFT_403392 [Benniella sp.]
MGLRFLRGLRILLVVFASIIFVIAVHLVRIHEITVFVCLTVFLALFSGIAYGWALKAQAAKRNIIKSIAARYTCSLLLCGAWLLSRGIILFVIFGWDPYYSVLGFAIDVSCFFMALLVFLEAIFAHRYERSFKALKRDAEAMGNIIVGPAPVQSTPHYTHYAQQYVYGPAQPQPGQPLMYYPQPAMTQQTLTMPYQDPDASYKILQETPAHQPHPPSTH